MDAIIRTQADVRIGWETGFRKEKWILAHTPTKPPCYWFAPHSFLASSSPEGMWGRVILPVVQSRYRRGDGKLRKPEKERASEERVRTGRYKTAGFES
eukprot:489677-Amorphochlora_amoeboformis.AAC.1